MAADDVGYRTWLMPDLSRFRFGSFELDLGTFKFLRDGVSLSVEPKALDLLRVLLERAPRVVDKAEIFSLVWKDIAVTDNALTRLVAQLRRALDDDPKAPRYIETVATRGYRFVAEVTLVSAASPRDAVTMRPTSQSGGIASARQIFPLSAFAVIAGIVLVSGALLVGWRMRASNSSNPSSGPNVSSSGLPDITTVASLKPQQLTTGQGYDGFLAFAPDGQSIAFSSDRSGALEVYEDQHQLR